MMRKRVEWSGLAFCFCSATFLAFTRLRVQLRVYGRGLGCRLAELRVSITSLPALALIWGALINH